MNTTRGESASRPFLLLNQLYRHIVDSRYLLVEHYRLEQRFYAETALQKGMLGDKERDSAFPQAHRIAVDHVVSHNLYVTYIVS